MAMDGNFCFFEEEHISYGDVPTNSGKVVSAMVLLGYGLATQLTVASWRRLVLPAVASSLLVIPCTCTMRSFILSSSDLSLGKQSAS